MLVPANAHYFLCSHHHVVQEAIENLQGKVVAGEEEQTQAFANMEQLEQDVANLDGQASATLPFCGGAHVYLHTHSDCARAEICCEKASH